MIDIPEQEKSVENERTTTTFGALFFTSLQTSDTATQKLNTAVRHSLVCDVEVDIVIGDKLSIDNESWRVVSHPIKLEAHAVPMSRQELYIERWEDVKN